MNSTIAQVHDALRTYQSILTKNLAKRAGAFDKELAKSLEYRDTVHISEEAVARLTQNGTLEPAVPQKTENTVPHNILDAQ